MTNEEIFIRVLDSGVAMVAILVLARIVMKLIEKIGN